jgi:anion transporter
MQTVQTIAPTTIGAWLTLRQLITWKLLSGIFGALVFTAGIWFGLPELGVYGRLAFITFGLAVMGWIFTTINDTLIAIAAALVFTIAGIDKPTEFFSALGDPLIWLMLTSFIIAAGVTTVGLSTRLAVAVAARTRSVNQLFYGLSLVMIATAFFIPATSGRAALMLPVFLALSKGINNPRISRALALLFPTIILLSAVASLIGAGAHLVTVDIIARMGGETLNFLRWTMLGLPFALASCLLSTWIILRLFLNAAERRQPLQLTASELAPIDPKKPIKVTGPLGRKEWYVIGVVTTLVLLWSTQPLHGLDNALVALLGALAITLPAVGVIDFKDALKSVEWNMLIFMAATLELGKALIESGAAQWLVEQSFTAFSDSLGASALAVVSAVTIISLLSHLVINSRTARSSVLVPLVVLLGVALGYNPVTLAFLSTAAAGFCLTLPVSAKPVTMFGKVDVATYTPNDLLKLSGVLLPLHFALLVGFTLWVWPWLGLDLKRTAPLTPPPAPTWENLYWQMTKVNIPLIKQSGDGIDKGGKAPSLSAREEAAGSQPSANAPSATSTPVADQQPGGYVGQEEQAAPSSLPVDAPNDNPPDDNPPLQTQVPLAATLTAVTTNQASDTLAEEATPVPSPTAEPILPPQPTGENQAQEDDNSQNAGSEATSPSPPPVEQPIAIPPPVPTAEGPNQNAEPMPPADDQGDDDGSDDTSVVEQAPSAPVEPPAAPPTDDQGGDDGGDDTSVVEQAPSAPVAPPAAPVEQAPSAPVAPPADDQGGDDDDDDGGDDGDDDGGDDGGDDDE